MLIFAATGCREKHFRLSSEEVLSVNVKFSFLAIRQNMSILITDGDKEVHISFNFLIKIICGWMTV